MAWTAEDCALLLQAMAGHGPEDPASVDRQVPDFTAGFGKGIKGLRFGVIRHFFETDHRASDATRAGIDDAMKPAVTRAFWIATAVGATVGAIGVIAVRRQRRWRFRDRVRYVAATTRVFGSPEGAP